jgi:hypothetical protein
MGVQAGHELAAGTSAAAVSGLQLRIICSFY